MNFKKVLKLFLIFAVPFLIAACTSPANLPVSNSKVTSNYLEVTSLKPSATVTIINDSFEPQNVTIYVGQAVKWVWDDNGYTHNVTFSNGTASPDKTSGSWILQFKKAGVFKYIDTLHFKVGGRVTVLKNKSY